MRRALPLAALLAVAACSRKSTDSALQVTVSFDPAATSKCVQVVARPSSGAEQRSGPAVRGTLGKLQVGVYRGALTEEVTVLAVGYADEGCTQPTSPTERSNPADATFVEGEVVPVALVIGQASAAVETNCTDGADDDADGKADCADEDCDLRSCLHGGRCSTGACRGASSEANLCADGQDNDGDGQTDCADSECLSLSCQGPDLCLKDGQCSASGECVGGTPVACTSPPGSCFGLNGACSNGRCVYQPTPGATCSDSSVCTTEDRCDAAGVCTGKPVVCDRPPPGPCFSALTATCDPQAGCQYPATQASCDDGRACTVADACRADGGCAGDQVTCVPNECQLFAGACLPDAGCAFDPRAQGSGCDGGVCNAFGSCVALFPYPPSNFTESQLATGPSGTVNLDCPLAVIDTGDGGAPSFPTWCAGSALPGVAVIAQPGGPDAVLLSFDTFNVSNSTTLRLQGSRPAIIAARGSASLQGLIEIFSGGHSCDAGFGRNGSTNETNGGGGGAGFGSAGGKGSNGATNGLNGNNGPGGVAGTVEGDETLVPLRGGCPGGTGANNRGARAVGGGALQVSVAKDLLVAGVLVAPGRGGAPGPGFLAVVGGGGAGSGGALLLEANLFTVSNTAALAAIGGGGGQGGSPVLDGEAGETGTSDGGVAHGGNAPFAVAGAGGNGALPGLGAEPGGPSNVYASGGSGGGAGVGRIRVNVRSACTVSGQALITPPASFKVPDAGCQ